MEIELANNENTVTKSSGGTGGDIVGGLFCGIPGAIIGSTFKNVNSKIYI